MRKTDILITKLGLSASAVGKVGEAILGVIGVGEGVAFRIGDLRDATTGIAREADAFAAGVGDAVVIDGDRVAIKIDDLLEPILENTQGIILYQEQVMEIARTIAGKSPLAIQGTKESILYARDHTVAESLDFISLWQTGMFQPTDMMESFMAQAEKRDPVYDDLPEIHRGL